MFYQYTAYRRSNGLLRKFLGTVAIILFSCSIASCTDQSAATTEPIPYVDIPAKNINTYIKLYDNPTLMNSHKTREDLTLQIINLSRSNIVFPENYHAGVFMQAEGKWIEIQNNFYNSGDGIILPTKEVYPLGLVVSYLPLAPISKPSTIRVSVDGYLEENKQVQVGAYLDVQLQP